jgi:hypothetical protein
MTLNLYVMPLTGAGVIGDARRPKYADSVFSAFNWSMFDYGGEPWCLVGILDIDDPTSTTLSGEPDAIALPVNLDQAIGSGPLATVRSDLESVNIPGTWVLASNSWRDVVQFVGAVCQFAQRFQGQTGGLWFTGGITLASTFSQLPSVARTGLTSAASSFGFNTSGITGASTIRAILLSAGQQYLATQPSLVLAGVVL